MRIDETNLKNLIEYRFIWVSILSFRYSVLYYEGFGESILVNKFRHCPVSYHIFQVISLYYQGRAFGDKLHVGLNDPKDKRRGYDQIPVSVFIPHRVLQVLCVIKPKCRVNPSLSTCNKMRPQLHTAVLSLRPELWQPNSLPLRNLMPA